MFIELQETSLDHDGKGIFVSQRHRRCLGSFGESTILPENGEDGSDRPTHSAFHSSIYLLSFLVYVHSVDLPAVPRVYRLLFGVALFGTALYTDHVAKIEERYRALPPDTLKRALFESSPDPLPIDPSKFDPNDPTTTAAARRLAANGRDSIGPNGQVGPEVGVSTASSERPDLSQKSLQYAEGIRAMALRDRDRKRQEIEAMKREMEEWKQMGDEAPAPEFLKMQIR